HWAEAVIVVEPEVHREQRQRGPAPGDAGAADRVPAVFHPTALSPGHFAVIALLVVDLTADYVLARPILRDLDQEVGQRRAGPVESRRRGEHRKLEDAVVVRGLLVVEFQ